MSNEIHLAFAATEARADALADRPPRDRIALRDHIVEIEIGAFQAERGITQHIRFNVVVEVNPPNAPLDDDVDRILSYDTITEAIAFELAEERLNLLETLAERVADRILLAPQAHRVFVRIEKLDRGPGALGIEIVRTHPKVLSPIEALEETHPHPTIVYLSNEAIGSGDISALLDSLSGGGRPIILCVGAPDMAAPTSRAAAAQRRIDLLAIEQNAWVLAGLDRRCVVVDSRTELDWAMKNGHISVWAPSKITLDAVDGPSADPNDALALVLWFAEHIEARELVVIGEEAPISETIQVSEREIGHR